MQLKQVKNLLFYFLSIAQTLMEKGLFKKGTILENAIIKNLLKVVEALIKAGASLDKDELDFTLRYGTEKASYILLASGASATTDSLHLAAGRGFIKIMEILLANRMPINAINQEGSPLEITINKELWSYWSFSLSKRCRSQCEKHSIWDYSTCYCRKKPWRPD